jgi:alpha(1,3/1,4) fucosyltransferase
MLSLRQIFRVSRRYYRDCALSKPYPIKIINCQWNNQHTPYNWLYQFIVMRGILNENSDKTLSIFSVNGDRIAIDFNRSDHKVFYTIENVHVPYSHWQKYEDLLLEKKSINLSLGFDYINHEQYLRFPYWLMTTFKPDDDFESIKKTCNLLNIHKIEIDDRINFCSFICRSDYFGERKIIYDQINKIDQVDCDGQFMNNNDVLKVKFKDNKHEFLESYRFNLCPENTNYQGYVTEKIFDALYSGCIPIYWGSNNNPEPEILNQNAILFYDMHGNNDLLFTKLRVLNQNRILYKEFAEQNRLKDEAPEIIYEYFNRLDKKLREILR